MLLRQWLLEEVDSVNRPPETAISQQLEVLSTKQTCHFRPVMVLRLVMMTTIVDYVQNS